MMSLLLTGIPVTILLLLRGTGLGLGRWCGGFRHHWFNDGGWPVLHLFLNFPPNLRTVEVDDERLNTGEQTTDEEVQPQTGW